MNSLPNRVAPHAPSTIGTRAIATTAYRRVIVHGLGRPFELRRDGDDSPRSLDRAHLHASRVR